MKQYLKEKWQFVVLLLRNLFNLPSEDGKRRLVQNPKTKVWEWTEGDAPLATTLEELQPDTENKTNTESVSGHSLSTTLSDVKPFEPKIGNRFIVNFPGIEPFFINKYSHHGKLSAKKMANGKIKIREQSSINMYLPIGVDNDIDIIKASKLKNLGNVSVEILDATGVAVRTINLKNIKIEEVNLYSDLDYDNSDPLIANVLFSHDQREFN